MHHVAGDTVDAREAADDGGGGGVPQPLLANKRAYSAAPTFPDCNSLAYQCYAQYVQYNNNTSPDITQAHKENPHKDITHTQQLGKCRLSWRL